jgi:hypothetical protein
MRAEEDGSRFFADKSSMTVMYTTWSVLIGFFILVLPLLAGIAGMIAMVFFKRTRTLGIVMLCLVGLLVMALGWVMFSYRAVRTESARFDGATEIANLEYLEKMREMNRSKSPQRPNDARTTKPAVAPTPVKGVSKTTNKAEAEPTSVVAPAISMIEAMGRALNKALAAKPQPPVTKPPEPKPPVAKPPEPKPQPASSLPDWANRPPRKTSDDAYLMTIVVGPWQTRQECDAQLPGELQKALDQYAEKCLGGPAMPRVVLPTHYLRQHVVTNQYEETLDSSVGPMKQLHVLLRFDDEVKKAIDLEHQRGMVVVRLWQVGIGLAVVLWPLLVIYAYLKTDLATGGAYRGRLRFAAVLAILGPVAAVLATVS